MFSVQIIKYIYRFNVIALLIITYHAIISGSKIIIVFISLCQVFFLIAKTNKDWWSVRYVKKKKIGFTGVTH